VENSSAILPNTAEPLPPEPPESAEPKVEERIKLSSQLSAIAAGIGEERLCFGDVVKVTHGRAYDLLLVLVSIPFLSPIGSIPMVALTMGSVMMLIGSCLALGIKPWLPDKALNYPLNPGILLKILTAGALLMRRFEKLLRPRLAFAHNVVFFQRTAGVLIAISGFLLALPIPFPLSNFFPAFTVMLLAAGALERDGVFFLAGCFMFLFTCAFFVALCMGGMEALHWLRDLLPDWGNQADAELLHELPVPQDLNLPVTPSPTGSESGE
jgi:hypothetical protein